MNTHREYTYVGSQKISQLLFETSRRCLIAHADDILQWVRQTQQQIESDHTITATFIINTDQQLWIADRRSEHVVCAAGGNVLSAGEITFAIAARSIAVTEITNQSTGYCPEPESWQIVERVLDHIGLTHPDGFTHEFLFRRCEVCGCTNIIKDSWFECAVCGSPLSSQWNYD